MLEPRPPTHALRHFWRERLPHFIVSRLFAPLGHLPLNVLRKGAAPLAHGLSWLAVWRPFQWDEYWPKSLPPRARLIRQSTWHLVMNVFEYAWLWQNPKINPQNAAQTFSITQGEALLQQHLGQSPVLILGGHFAQWEVLPVALTLRGMAATPPFSGNGLYRLGRHQWVESLLQWRNRRPPFVGFPAGINGVGELIKRLRKNAFSYILVDQVPPEGGGDWLHFFGEPAYTMRLAAKLSTQKGLQTWFCTTLRTPTGFALAFDDLTETLAAHGADLRARGQAINDHLEKRIREHPELYVWQYPRFRHPKGSGAPLP